MLHYRVRKGRDFIPYLDSKGAERSKASIITIESDPKAPFHDHSFMSPTYVEPLRQNIQNFLDGKW